VGSKGAAISLSTPTTPGAGCYRGSLPVVLGGNGSGEPHFARFHGDGDRPAVEEHERFRAWVMADVSVRDLIVTSLETPTTPSRRCKSCTATSFW
jgi:hypothetical protein